MYNKKLTKIYAGCALSMALAMAATPVNVFAAEGDDTPAAGSKTKIDPTAEDYADTDIDVWGYTNAGIVYSVDVEWGAMTVQYETDSWNPDTHTAAAGAGWVVYDSVNNKVLGDVQDAINRVTVTNHSNAAVYAKLTYTSEADFGTTGTFAAIDTNKQTATNTAADFNATFDADKAVITLQTADNSAGDGGTSGKATVGNVYFKPDGIADAKKTANGIAQWTKIGKITVSLSTTDPTAP